MNVSGPPPVPFQASAPSLPSAAGQPLQIVAVTGASGADRTGASGSYADRRPGADADARRSGQKPPSGEETPPPARATGESVVGARIKSQETPGERLAAARSELVARQQDRIQAATRREQSQAERDITSLREMIAALETEIRSLEPRPADEGREADAPPPGRRR